MSGTLALMTGLLGSARGAGQADTAAVKSEYGIVIAHSGTSVQLQVYNEKSGEVELHLYMRTAETRSDGLHAGDQVQVLFVWNGQTRVLRRAAMLAVPLGSGVVGKSSGVAAVRPQNPPDLSRKSKGPATQPATQASLPASFDARAGKTVTATAAVELGGKVQAKVQTVTAVPLGIDAGYGSKATQPVSREVAFEAPASACHASDKDWTTSPLRIVVLDFRYPTEREEAHDVGSAGGGSGMAVADLVYARLKRLPEFAVDRGDRRRLDRADIAGAARLGRELGADAVLEGTFFPVEETKGDADGVKGYVLHAGVVDTCTGQVLLTLRSEDCPTGAACRPLLLSPEMAQDPGAHAETVSAAADALLTELAGSAAAGMQGTGIVEETGNGTVTVRMAVGTALKPGDRLSVLATRLAKNPTTYTLQYKRASEIGRVVVRHVDGATASGGFDGDIPPKVGDWVKLLHE